ncbi:MAG: hypothetical protein ACI8PT_003945 [Gammaproteobacteria bacterium]|jgi:hypothetical protein
MLWKRLHTGLVARLTSQATRKGNGLPTQGNHYQAFRDVPSCSRSRTFSSPRSSATTHSGCASSSQWLCVAEANGFYHFAAHAA